MIFSRLSRGQDPSKGTKRNRFKYLNFRESLARVDIDVYRSVKHYNVNPKTGDNFLHDSLQEYRELCLHRAFLDVHSKIFPLCQSIAQVVYHRELIFRTILDQVTCENKLSLEALMVLLSSMARDLQGDFLGYLGPIVSAVETLFATGGGQDAAIIEHAFTGLYRICKFLVRELTGSIEAFAECAVPLLFNRLDHVRSFAAEWASFVFRNAEPSKVRSGVVLLAGWPEARSCGAPVGTRLEAVGLLVAHSLLSTRDHMHSKAGAVFSLLLDLSFSAPSEAAGDLNRDSAASVALVTLHKLRDLNRKIDLSLPLAVLSGHLKELVSFRGKVDVARAKMVAWALKMANMLTSAVEPARSAECVAETYEAVLKALSKPKKQYAYLAAFEDCGRGGDGLAALEEQLEFSLEEVEEIGAPKLMPELFAYFFGSCAVLHSQGEGSHEATLKLAARLVQGWAPRLSLEAVKDFCDILTRFLGGRPQLAEPLAPLAFFMVNETLRGDGLLEEVGDCEEILTRTLALHVASGGFVGNDIRSELSSLLLGTAREVVQVGKSMLGPQPWHPGSAGDGAVMAFLPVLYLILRLVQRLGVEADRAAVGGILSGHIAEGTAEALVLESEAAKTAMVSREAYMEVEGRVAEIFSSAGRAISEIPLLKNMIWLLDAPFLPEGHGERLLSSLSQESWDQVIANLGGRNKGVRLRTLELLSKGGVFRYAGSMHGDTDGIFDDLLSIFETKFTLGTSRAISNRIRRYALDVEYKKLDGKYAGILAHIFTGYLNEAFSECWEPSVSVLSELVSRHFDATFGAVWGHLMACHSQLVHPGDVAVQAQAGNEEASQTAFGLDLADEPTPRRRPLTLIPVKYKLLVSSLKSNNQVWAKKFEEVVPAFVEFSDAVLRGLPGVSGQHSNDILFEWIAIMESIPKVHKASVGPMLKQKLETLLSKVSPTIQVQILKSLKSWKVPVLSARADILIQACNLKTEKDLLPFQRQHNAEKGLSEEERAILVPLLLRILFPKMKRKKMRLTSRRSQGTARKSILHFLSCFDTSELRLLHELFIHPMLSFGGRGCEWSVGGLVSLHESGKSSDFLGSWSSGHIPLNVQAGFLDTFKDFLGCLGRHMRGYLFPWVGISLCFLRTLCEDGVVGAQQQDPAAIVSLCLGLLTEIFETYDDEEVGETLGFVETALVALKDTKYFQTFQVFNSAVLFLRNILTSEVWSERVKDHVEVRTMLDSLFDRMGEMSAQRKKVVLSLVDSVLDEAPEATAPILEKYYPRMLDEVKAMDFKSGDRQDMVSTLSVVQRMSDLFSGGADALATLQVLVGSLKWFRNKKAVSKNESLLRSILRVIRSLGSARQDNGRSFDINFKADLPPLVDLFLYTRQCDLRAELCEILELILAGSEASASELSKFCGLCKDLNAVSSAKIGEIDYDRRLAAYSAIEGLAWASLGPVAPTAQKILLHQCVFDLTEIDDFSMQQASSEALKRFITACKAGGSFGLGCEYRESAYSLLKVGIHSKKEGVRKEYLHLLSHLFLEFPVEYEGMSVLCDQDQEQDFFKNVTHLQLHRRVRAVNKVGTLMAEGRIGQDAVVDVIVPVLMGFICDDAGASQGGTASNLVDKCIEGLGEASRRVEWPTLRGMLGRFLRILKGKGQQSKSIMRAVSSTMRFFEEHEEEGQEVEAMQVDGEAAGADARQFSEPLGYVYRVLLPYLSALFYQDRDPPSYLVAVLAQVLRVMPENLTRIELPQLIQRMSSRLKNDLGQSRINTREAICALLDVTGPAYLSSVLNSIDSSLMNRGVQGYIKCYSVYYVLKNVEGKMRRGEVDEHLDAFFTVFRVDLFGDVARDRQERKDSEKLFAKTFKEGQRCFSLSAFEVIAGLVDAEESLQHLLDFVEEGFTVEKRRVRMCERLLECVARGILSSSKVDHQFLLVLFYGIMDDLNAAILEREAKLEAFKDGLGISTRATLAENEGDDQEQRDFLVLEVKAGFALTVLWKLIKGGSLGEGLSKEDYLKLLDPWTGLLAPVLRSRKASLVVLALKCLNRLYMLPLGTNGELAPKVSKEALTILRRNPKLSDPAAQECLKLLTILLKHYERYSPTQTQLNFLIRLVSPDIEKTENQNGLFSFLKAVISRGIVLPSVYDLMDKVSAVVLSSGSDSTRRTAGQVFLMYLLDYPMNDNRRKHHLEFVVKNSDFAHEAGRLSMLELVSLVVKKFPEEIIADLAEMFLFPLVLRVCNEDSRQCRAFASDALVSLLARSRDDFNKKARGLAMGWLKVDKMALKAAGCQLLLHLHKSEKLGPRGTETEVLASLVEELKLSVEEDAQATPKFLEFALRAADVMLGEVGSKAKADCQAILGISQSLLLVPNAAIKGLSAALLRTALGALPSALSDLARFQGLFRAVVDQMQAEISLEFGEALSSLVRALLGAFDLRSIEAAEEDVQGADLPLSVTGTGSEEDSLKDYLFALKRVISLAAGNTTKGRPATAEQQGTALRVLLTFAETLPEDKVAGYLAAFMVPAFHMSESKRPAPLEVQEASEALVKRLDDVAGSEAVASAFNKARTFVQGRRKDRRQSKAVLKMVDPEQAARNKVTRNLKRKVSRKRQKDKGVFKKKRRQFARE